jgi:hypothetical protein
MGISQVWFLWQIKERARWRCHAEEGWIQTKVSMSLLEMPVYIGHKVYCD